MSNPIIQNLWIELSKSKKEKKELQLKIIRLMNEIQMNINPYFENFKDIKAENIEQASDELLLCTKRAVEIEEKIENLTKELDHGD